MSKQEFILKVLTLFPNWEVGWGIKAMVENNQLSEHALNVLVVVLKRGLDNLTSVVKQYRIGETVEAAKNLNQQKVYQEQKDQQDLAALDSMIDNFNT